MNRLTELYLQSAQELHPGGVQVAGILGRNDRHTGRMMLRLPVLGIPEQVAEVIQTLSVHGVAIDRIVVTLPWTGLTPAAQSALRDIESGRDIRVQYLAHDLGFAPRDGACGGASDFKSAAHEDEARFDEAPGDLEDALMVPREERAALKQRPYWAVKRCLDILGAVTLILLLAPIMAIAALMVLLDLGGPVLFWQQRPGLAGRPFRVYKLRTMRAAYDENGLLIPDAQRMSWIGQFLRRTRIDELPQLFQIVKGDMSFIGPRPLLPGDQPVGYAARLLIRPGLTGWAQVSGGRQLSMVDKAALDLWYVRHASLWLDIKILVRTAFMLLFGERARPEVIRDSWSDVRRQKQMDPAAAPHLSASTGRPGSEKTRRAA
jgi:lipopolysaccharide/colanic/teichoic acid biosynthesis glycosyltransferase